MNADKNKPTVYIISGLSGSGKSTTLSYLEDIGFDIVDNMPLSLLRHFLKTPDSPTHEAITGSDGRNIAIGIDLRTRGFETSAVIDAINTFRRGRAFNVTVMFLDTTTESLIERYSETRRKHPLALDRPVIDGIEDERKLLDPIRKIADFIIDTSGLKVPDLKARLADIFRPKGERYLALECMSFGFSKGLPRNADMVLDVRFLRNPHYEATLRPLTGQDENVGAFILGDDNYKPFFHKTADLIQSLLPLYIAEGKSYFTIAIGCTGGRHRSVFVVEQLAEFLQTSGYNVNIRHRDLTHKDTKGSPT